MTADGDAGQSGTGAAGRDKAPGGPLDRARPRVRILLDGGARIGPGKIDLLEAIAATGSISAAGRALGMSYRRAWLLATETDRLFDRPLVVTAAGGAGGGGARLTDLGAALVAAYRRIEARALAAIREELAPFAADFAAEPRAATPAPPEETPEDAPPDGQGG
jgi:molybdate transport system regulatory protein